MTDSENQAQQPSQQDLDAMGVGPDAEKLKDVRRMGDIVTRWHFDVMQRLHHQLQMPEDVGIDIPTGQFNEDGSDICIDGNADHRLGFLTGIHFALEVLDTFPIKGVPEDGEG